MGGLYPRIRNSTKFISTARDVDKKQHLFQEKMATSSVFDKCFLVSLKIRIPSFAAGAPQMVPPKEKTHYLRHDYCR